MFDELFNQSFVVARYQNAPHAESRANFLKKAREEGYPISTLERIAWALLVVAQAVNFNAGRVTATEPLATFARKDKTPPTGGWSQKPEVMAFLRAL